MPLLDPGSKLSLEKLRDLRRSTEAELEEALETLQDSPGADAPRRARGYTARGLVNATLAWAKRARPEGDRPALIAEINLLYDVGVVAAEYYKLFVRDPTRERPAGRI